MTDNAMNYLKGVVACGFNRNVNVPVDMNYFEHGYSMACGNELGEYWLVNGKEERMGVCDDRAL